LEDPVLHDRDAFEHEHQLEPGWSVGDVEFDDEPPSTERTTAPGQRNWLLLGAGICGLITAAVVLSVSARAPDPSAKRLELPATAFRTTPETKAPAVSEPERPEIEASTLAATLGAADASPDLRRFRAPPPPPLADDARAEPTPAPAPAVRQPSVVEPKPVAVEPVAAAPGVSVEPALGELPSIEDEHDPVEPADLEDPIDLADQPDQPQLVDQGDPSALLDVASDPLPTLYER
jgi:hypothetical protein